MNYCEIPDQISLAENLENADLRNDALQTLKEFNISALSFLQSIFKNFKWEYHPHIPLKKIDGFEVQSIKNVGYNNIFTINFITVYVGTSDESKNIKFIVKMFTNKHGDSFPLYHYSENINLDMKVLVEKYKNSALDLKRFHGEIITSLIDIY